ncbi:MAG: UDP-N-acetylmuramate dehydrogenase [bacterium]|nr:UDP-N-acetylmuramate dehydrogenase [bacterium]
MNLALELKKITPHIKFNEPMSSHTSLRIGGPADIFIEVGNEEELKKIVELVYQSGTPYFILGGGTNLLVGDNGIRGVVIKLVGEFKRIKVSDRGIIIGAGVPLTRLVNWASAKGLSGLEFAVGIPGTVGGAVIGNAGVAEKTIGDCITRVRVMDKQKVKIENLTPQKCGFSYRMSQLKKYIILDVEILLTKSKICSIVNRLEGYKQKRWNTQPIKTKSAGCIFKNPPGNFAGKLIDEAGLKGLRLGGAYVSHKHANFILNDGTASAENILDLIAKIKEKVLDKFGITLEEEIVIVGED